MKYLTAHIKNVIIILQVTPSYLVGIHNSRNLGGYNYWNLPVCRWGTFWTGSACCGSRTLQEYC